MEDLTKKNSFFGFKLSSARMVIECAFGRPKGRFGCLRREMDINIDNLLYVIHACFLLHNICELYKKPVHQILLKLPRNMTVISNQTIKTLGIKQAIMKVKYL